MIREKRVDFSDGPIINFYVGRAYIAYYYGSDNTLYLRTRYLLSKTSEDSKKPYSVRILGSRFEAEYKKLLSRYEGCLISEYEIG